MSSSSLPQWHSFTKFSHGRYTSCRHNCVFFSFNNIPRMGIFFSSILVGLIFYMAVLSPHDPLLLSSLESHGLFQLDTNTTQHLSSNKSTPTNHASSSPTSNEAPSSSPTSNKAPSSLSNSDDLSLEQIRDIVAPTRGFFTRDYSLYLGWNNVSIHRNPFRAELMIS